MNNYYCDFCGASFKSKVSPFEFGGKEFCEACKKDIFEMIKKSY